MILWAPSLLHTSQQTRHFSVLKLHAPDSLGATLPARDQNGTLTFQVISNPSAGASGTIL